MALDFCQGFAFGFRQDEVDEDGSKHTIGGVDPKNTPMSKVGLHDVEELESQEGIE